MKRSVELREAIVALIKDQGHDWQLDWDNGVEIRLEKDGSVVAVDHDEEDNEIIVGRVLLVVG